MNCVLITCIVLTVSIYQCCLVSSIDIPAGVKEVKEIITGMIFGQSTTVNSMMSSSTETIISTDTISSTETIISTDTISSTETIDDCDENGGEIESPVDTPEYTEDCYDAVEENSMQNSEEEPACEMPTDESRAGIVGEIYRWPKATVPIVIDPNFPKDQRNNILQAMADISAVTCVKFTNRVSSKNFVYFLYGGGGCSSPVGMQGDKFKNSGNQTISLSRGAPAMNGKPRKTACAEYVSVVTHEIMHALGFGHEMVRPDRDQYVEIDFSNVEPGHRHNFEYPKYYNQTTFGIPFDYQSIMMYRWNDFAIDTKKATITAKQAGIGKNFKGEKMSANDIRAINTMYNCR